jgi:hypothetical protein
MSEYQYYEFVAVDRPLNDKELDAVRATSTRARITRTSFVNEYHFGDFKGSPDRMVEKYFDAHLYVSNFRSQRFMFRVPASTLDPSAIEAYGGAEVPEIRRVGEIVLLDFNCNLDEIDEEGTQDAEGLMASLIPLRDEVLSGDLRALYLGWLSGVHHGLVGDEDPEPAVPPGLRTLTAAQSALVEFLCLDQDLVEEAAHSSDELATAAIDARLLGRWLADLPGREKDGLLLRHLSGEEPNPWGELDGQVQGGASRSERGAFYDRPDRGGAPASREGQSTATPAQAEREGRGGTEAAGRRGGAPQSHVPGTVVLARSADVEEGRGADPVEIAAGLQRSRAADQRPTRSRAGQRNVCRLFETRGINRRSSREEGQPREQDPDEGTPGRVVRCAYGVHAIDR